MENTDWQRLTRAGPTIAAIGQWKKEGYNFIMFPGSTDFPEHNQNEFMKRAYLLPDGCKDLADLYLKSLPQMSPKVQVMKWGLMKPHLPFKGVLMIRKGTTVQQLAQMLGQKPFQIIADVLTLGVFPNEQLDFETISKIAEKYGFLTKEDDQKTGRRQGDYRRRAARARKEHLLIAFNKAFKAHSPKGLIKGVLAIPKPTSISQLAAMVGQTAVQIVADLGKLGIFVRPYEELDFEIISKIAGMYGFLAKKGDK